MNVEILRNPNKSDLENLEYVLKVLSRKYDRSVDEKMLSEVMESKHHEIFVARDENLSIIGMAILSVILDLADGKIAYLSDFVVSDKTQSRGVGGAIWDEMINWCQAQNIAKMEFTSNAKRVAAHKFYMKHGAKTYDTTVFKVDTFAGVV